MEQTLKLSSRRWAWPLWSLAGAVLVLAALAGLAYWQFGSVSAAQAYLQGERLLVEPARLSFGEGPRGEKRTLTFTVRNFTGKDVVILGSTASCSCVAADQLPLTIAAGERRELAVKVALTGKATEFTEEIFFFTDSSARRVIKIEVRGRITGPE